MFVPGVNGSIIANSNAPSGSKLKGAYKNSKNSKKRKMPNGALTYTPYSKSQNQYTDTPSPKPMIKPRVGDTINPNYEKLVTDLAVDAGSLLPGGYGKAFNIVSKLRATEDDNYTQGLEFVPGKKASLLSVANDVKKISDAQPYKYQGRKMPYGGSMPITNVSSQGDLDYSVSKRVGNFTGNLQGSVNAPSMSSNYAQPKLAYNRKALSSYVTPSGFGAGLQGNKTYVNYDQSKQGIDMYRSGAAGYNTDKVNVNANANFRNNLLESAGVEGSYSINPNLSVTGNYGVSQGESGLDKNYFAGLRFNKTFKQGGKQEKGNDKEMVDGVASILKGVKDKKNRLQLANKLAKQFNREKVKYSLSDFLNKSKVKK